MELNLENRHFTHFRAYVFLPWRIGGAGLRVAVGGHSGAGSEAQLRPAGATAVVPVRAMELLALLSCCAALGPPVCCHGVVVSRTLPLVLRVPVFVFCTVCPGCDSSSRADPERASVLVIS